MAPAPAPAPTSAFPVPTCSSGNGITQTRVGRKRRALSVHPSICQSIKAASQSDSVVVATIQAHSGPLRVWCSLPGGGGLHRLEFLHFEFCTKTLYAICLVFSRICAGNNGKRPLFLMSNYWVPHIICSLIFKKWRRFCRARICRFIFSPTRNPPPPPGTGAGIAREACRGHSK